MRIHVYRRVYLFQWVGPSCGHHASYAFYKAIRYTHKKTGAPKILSLGEFFFVKGRTE